MESEVREMMSAAYGMEHGEERLQAFQAAADAADREELTDLQMDARLEILEESAFYCDSLKLYVIFPELLKISDTCAEKTGRYPYLHSILWDYKWLLGNAEGFYQVTRQQFDALAADMKERYRNHRYSLRPVYEQMFDFYSGIDDGLADRAYQEYLKEERDSLSDCHACERSVEVQYLLEQDRITEALKQAEPLMSGRLTCTEQPYATYAHLLFEAARRKILGRPEIPEIEEEIKTYAEKTRHAIVRKHLLQEFIGEMLIYYCIYEPNRALPWIKTNCDYTESNMEPYSVFTFCLGMMLFLEPLKEKKTYRMKMDPRFRFYQESGSYDVQKMYDDYDRRAKEIADAFVRNQGRRSNLELYQAVRGATENGAEAE